MHSRIVSRLVTVPFTCLLAWPLACDSRAVVAETGKPIPIGAARPTAAPTTSAPVPSALVEPMVGLSRLAQMIAAVNRGDVAWLKSHTGSIKDVLNERDSTGYCALHHAAESGQVQSLQWLLETGADPRVSTPFGMTPLLLAVRAGQLAAAKAMLRSSKVDVNQRFPLLDDITPLMHALILRNEALAEALLSAGADPNVPSDSGNSLHIFARMNSRFLPRDAVRDYSRIGRLLITAGADVNFRLPRTGRTPFMLAVEHANLSAIEFLFQHGADVNALDNQNKTALDLATPEIAPALVAKGARRGASFTSK